MNLKTRKTLLAALFATTLAVGLTSAVEPRAAEACGYYSEKDYVSAQLGWMFSSSESSADELRARYPALSRREIAQLRRGSALVRTRWIKVDETRATAVIEVETEVPGRGTLLSTKKTTTLEVTFAAGKGAGDWQPSSIKPAGVGALVAIKISDRFASFSRRRAASAVPATR